MVQKVAQQEIYQTPQEAPVGPVLPIIPTRPPLVPIRPPLVPTKTDAVLRADVSRVETGITPTVPTTVPKVEAARSTAAYAREMAIAMTPILGTLQYAEQAKKDGLTAGEMGWIAGSAILDILCLIPFIGGIAAGARAAKGIGTGARIAAMGKGIGRVAIAEVKAPYTMVRHPITTVKGVRHMIDPVETLLHRKKLPLTAAEIREATIRLPISAVGSKADTMLLRDMVMGKVTSGVKPIARVGDTQFELSRVAMQRTAVPVAIHSTPDVSVFLNPKGTIVKVGREGGLYTSSSAHSRFTIASAFGDMPESGVRGALIFRDPKILSQLTPSGKIYQGTAEMELVLKAGVKIPPPSQTLFTRDILGDRLALVVFGKPFSAAEIAKMKIIGSVDLIKNIFTNPAKVSKLGKTAIKEYDELNDLRKAVTVAKAEAKQLRTQGKIKEAVEATRRATHLQTRVDRLSIRLSTRIASRTMTSAGLRLAALNFQRTGPLERWERVTSTGRRIAKADRRTTAGIQKVRTLSEIDVPTGIRVRTTRDDVKRPRIPSPKRVAGLGRISDRIEEDTREDTRIDRIGIPDRVRPDIPDRIPPPEGRDRVPLPDRDRVDVLDRRLPPDRLLLRLPPKDAYKKLTPFQKAGAVAWKQGWIYKLIYPPYGQKDIINSKEPIAGVKIVSGARSAYESIVKARDKRDILQPEITRDMGIMDIRITTPERGKGKPKLQFKRDVKQKTRTTPVGISGIRKKR